MGMFGIDADGIDGTVDADPPQPSDKAPRFA
jgi:hypothetical protein